MFIFCVGVLLTGKERSRKLFISLGVRFYPLCHVSDVLMLFAIHDDFGSVGLNRSYLYVDLALIVFQSKFSGLFNGYT